MSNKISTTYFAATAVEGFLVAGIIYGGRQATSGLILNSGLTLKNLILFSAAIILSFLSVGIILRLKEVNLDIRHVLVGFRERYSLVFDITILFFLWLLFECIQDILYIFSPIAKPNIIFDSYQRLLISLIPFLLWGILISVQSLVFIYFATGKGKIQEYIKNYGIPNWIIVFIIFLTIWSVIAFTEFGYIPGTSNLDLVRQVGRFLPSAKPLPGMQVVLIFLGTGLLFQIFQILSKTFPELKKNFYSQAIICLLIWITAFSVWNLVPIAGSSTIDITNNPVVSIYPNSDALYFDREAYRFLAGEGFLAKSTHVMYSFFLSGVHSLAGDGYLNVIAIQYGFLAFIPVFLYRFTKELHTSFSGLAVAVLYIFRERNGLLIGGELGGPVVNQLISENLALLGMISFLYVVHLWMDQPGERKLYPHIAGGIMGISLMIRADYAAALFAVFIIMVILFWKDKKTWLRGMIPLLLVVGIIITPWMFRNWRNTGIFSLDKGDFVGRRVTAYIQNISSLGDNPDDSSEIIEKNPGEFNGRIITLVNHVGNNFHQTFLYLPNSSQPLLGLGPLSFQEIRENENMDLSAYLIPFSKEYLKLYTSSLPYYWYTWDGIISGRSVIAIPSVLLMISIGLGFLWKRQIKTLLILLSAFFAHIMIWSFAGFSGSRYIIAIDWIMLVFFVIGLTELIKLIIQRFNRKDGWILSGDLSFQAIDSPKPELHQNHRIFEIISIIGLILVGLGPTVLENNIPTQYTESQFTEKMSEIISSGQDLLPSGQNCFEESVKGIEQRMMYGQALYPRYYEQGELLVDDRRETIKSPAGPRIDFYLFGTENFGITMPESDPHLIFPHHIDAIVTGSYLSDRYVEARCVYLFEDGSDQKFTRRFNCTGNKCRLE